MKHTLLPLALALPILALTGTAFASDYTYQQTTQLTGGSLLHMMKTVGVFSSQARHMGDPIVSTIYLKNNRLANVSPENIEIIDLDQGNHDADRRGEKDVLGDNVRADEAGDRKCPGTDAAADLAQQPTQPAANPDAQNVKMSFDVKVRNTGVQKQISGLDSSEAVMTLMMNATDTQTQQQGSMAITNDMWMVPSIPGYDQVRDFYKRFAAKMSDSTMGLGFDFSKMLAQNPAAGQAMSDMAGEMQKLKGVPIMQVMRMGTTVNGQPLPAASEAPLPAEQQGPTGGQVAKSALGSMMPFGFGKKKNNADQDSNQNNGSAQAQPTSAILMETQITTSNFSSAPVDPSHFEVPAGYKQVQTQMQTRPSVQAGSGR